MRGCYVMVMVIIVMVMVITVLVGSFVLHLLLLLLLLFPMHMYSAALRHLQVILVFAYPLLSCSDKCQPTDVSNVTTGLAGESTSC